MSLLLRRLTNCHHLNSGLSGLVVECPEDDIQACTQSLGKNVMAYHSYTQFLNHIDNICFYIQRDHFEESTEKAVHSLYTAAIATTGQLNFLHREVIMRI